MHFGSWFAKILASTKQVPIQRSKRPGIRRALLNLEALEDRRVPTAGLLDTAFGSGGKVFTSLGQGNDQAYAMAIDGNGKMLLAGQSFTGSNDDFSLARYNQDGSLDTSFDLDGKVTTAFGPGDDGARSVKIDASGKIVVAGFSSDGTRDVFALARYNEDGSLDTSFGGDGKVTTDFSSQYCGATALAIDGNGKIVVAGYAYLNDTSYDDFALARYNQDGSLDTSFDSDGKATIGFGNSADIAYSVAIDGFGKIVVAGTSFDGKNNIGLARLNQDGSLDTTFDGDGKATTFIDSQDVRSLALDGSGHILVAGTVQNGVNPDFALVRFNRDGSLDTSFGTGGTVVTNWDSSLDHAAGLALDGNGKIVVAGSSNNDFAVVRYNSNGSLDTSFAADGKLVTDLGTQAGERNGVANGVAIDGHGRIVVAGYSSLDSKAEFALTRYEGDGTLNFGNLDPTFGIGGKVVSQLTTSNEFVKSVALDGNGNIVAVGGGITGDISIARFHPDGSLDTSFATQGQLNTSLGLSVHLEVSDEAIDGNGNILVGGFYYDVNDIRRSFLVRFDSLGTLDPSFGNDGVLTAVGPDSTITSLTIDGNGKIVAAGLSSDGGGYPFALARFDANGTLDTSFNVNGMAAAPAGFRWINPESVTIDRAGKITVAGSAYNRDLNKNVVVLLRYNADGSPDLSFDTDGEVQVSLNPYLGQSYSHESATSIALDADGKIVVAGYVNNGTNNYSNAFNNQDFAVLRLNSDGSLDSSFGQNGRVVTDFAFGTDAATSVAIDGNGNIVAAGTCTVSPLGATEMVLARYRPDGSLDTTFGNSGKGTVDFGSIFENLNDMVIDGQGNILVAGGAQNGFALARFGGPATDRPTFAWAAVDGTASYDLWITDTTTGQDPVLVLTNLSGTSFTLTEAQALSPGHQYRWWVRGGTPVGVSNTFAWSTPTDLTIPALARPSPAGPQGIQSTDRVTITWSPALPLTAGYQVWLTDLTTGSGGVIGRPTTTSLDVVLSPGHSYRWWVRAVSSNGTSGDWSTATDFRVQPWGVPTITSPSGLQSNDQVTITWSTVTLAAQYEVWLSDLTSGVGGIAGGSASTFFTAPALSPAHSYRCWVRALSNNGTLGDWSAAADFAIPPEEVPILTGPTALQSSDHVTFTWSSVARSSSYDVWLSDLTVGTGGSLGTSTQPSFSDLTALSPGHSYRWWVRAVSANGTAGSWSAPRDFTIQSLDIHLLAGPTGLQNSDQVTFTWSNVAVATGYDVWLSDQTIGSGEVLGSSFTPSLMAPAALSPGHSYRWWVRAFSSDGTIGSWNGPADFAIQTLGVPIPSGPSGNVGGPQAFSWSAAAMANTYDVSVDDLTTGQSQVLRKQNITGLSWNAPILPGNHAYRWWVRARGSNDTVGPWSAGTDFFEAN